MHDDKAFDVSVSIVESLFFRCVQLLRRSPRQTLSHGTVVRRRLGIRLPRSFGLCDPSIRVSSSTSYPRASWHRRSPTHPPSRTTRVRRLVDAPPRVRSKGGHVRVRTRTFRVCFCKRLETRPGRKGDPSMGSRGDRGPGRSLPPPENPEHER